jgi:hypothetical protein
MWKILFLFISALAFPVYQPHILPDPLIFYVNGTRVEVPNIVFGFYDDDDVKDSGKERSEDSSEEEYSLEQE